MCYYNTIIMYSKIYSIRNVGSYDMVIKQLLS